MKVGIIQITSLLNPVENLDKIRGFLAEAKLQQCEAIFLPEVFYSMSDGHGATPYLVDGKDEHYCAIQKLASDYGIAILGGTAATKDPESDKVLNRNYNFSADGSDLGFYDKINIFSCDVERDGKRVVLDEGKVYSAGSKMKLIKYGPMTIGVSICFDIRYPEMYREYLRMGANVLSISAAFTVPTGKAHWETLVCARAIENQCFVIAPGQWGTHNDKIQTFGHSMIVDPWGRVLANAEEGEKLITAELDFSQIEFVRKSIVLFK
ncbi:MAG: hypothetical protein KAG61_07635 [Bacteriovoracaceae bacterium]|nr:hypothetical protein [Bacteriovoracaceae bacterium]